ncbi:MAG TPA: sulfotransferase [Fimbriimonadaceae bacterium]
MEELLATAKDHYRCGKLQLAANLLEQVLSESADEPEANLLQGIICAKTERYEEAETYLLRSLQASPDQPETLIWLSISLKSQSRFEEAVAIAEKAVQIRPDAATYNALGVCQLSRRNPREAIAAFEKVIAFDPTLGAAYQNLGMALRMAEKRFEALDAFKKAVALAPENPENWLQLCDQLQRLSRWTDVIETAHEGLARFPKVSAFMIVLANSYAMVRQHDAAEDMFRQAMALKPSTSQSYAQWLVEQGRFEESLQCLVQSVKLKPVQGYAYYCLAESKWFEIDGESWLPNALENYDSPSLRLKDRIFLDYALGMAYEARKDAGHAIQHFDKACEAAFRIYNAGRPFALEGGLKTLEKRKSLFNAATIESLKHYGDQSETPILIVGMIRSGTTLLEQIVSSHPDVKAAGELSFWLIEADRLGAKWGNTIDPADLAKLASDYQLVLETMAGKAPRITDKMPLNFEHLGLVHAAFPKAKILHIRRNPVDTCLSIYTTHYGPGPNFAYKQENIVSFYRGYLHIMEHWRDALPPEQFFELDYEDLIASKEQTTRDIMSFLELPWNDACLHHEDNQSAINTPSRYQARQPIYNSSVERWRRYEPYLGALLDLKDVKHPTPRNNT